MKNVKTMKNKTAPKAQKQKEKKEKEKYYAESRKQQ